MIDRCIMTLAINSVTRPKAAAPGFREKDAVCIEARASKTTTTIKPVQPRSFQYQLADMQIAAQLLRYQGDAPGICARDVALAYQQNSIAAATGIRALRV